MRPLYHALYTNAFGSRGAGFRPLFHAPGWPSADQERIVRWLRSLQPIAGEAEWIGVAVNCFRLGGTIHACLARVDGGFARDEHGRAGGLLAHALLTPLVEGQPPGPFSLALLRASRELERPAVDDTEKLDAYLGQCRATPELAVPEANVGELLAIDPPLLQHFFAVASNRSQAREVGFAVASAGELAELLARAGALLPPRLALACRWAIDLRAAPAQTFLARPRRATTPPGSGPEAAYDSWLRQRIAAGRGREVTALTENWEIRSWDELLARIR